MLPGKTYSPEDIFQILRKRIWLILVPFALVSAITAVVARKLPDSYRSEALILVVPQRVPESFVRSTVTQRIEDRLLSIAQTILSRSQLERIITELNLYADERNSGAIMEDVVEQMRTRDITTRTDKGDAFRIAYTGPNKRVVKEVTEKLTSLFISENVRNRGNLADGTSQFLEASLEEARRNLKDQEEKVAQFRQRYAGELPNQMDSNIQAQRSTEMQIQALVESLRNDRERQINYERAIADAEQELADVPVTQPAMASTPGMPPSTLAQKVAAARSHLADLRTRYRDTNVDVVRAKHELEELEALLKKEEQPEHATATDGRPMPVVSNQEFQRRKRLEDLRGQLERLERKIAEGEKEEKRLRAVVGAYQRRVEAVPSRETELAELTRGYDSLRGIFEDRFRKLEDARTAANLERRQIGEQFQLLEPPRIPERPYSPNRQAINLFGLMAGLGCGLALAALFEYRDKSFKTDQEISHLLALPVLAVVPLMQSAVEKRTAWKMQLILGIGCGTVVAGCLAVVAYATFVLR